MKKNLLQTTLRGGLVLAFVLIGLSSFGQITSATVDVHFETGIDPYDSLSTDVMHVDATIDDIDFMGEILVTVYEPSTDFPIARIKMTKAELEDESLITGSVATIKIYGFDPAEGYQIETLVRNYQGGNFPKINTDYNIQ